MMIVHQKTQMLHTRMINKVEVQSIICQKKGKDLNWVVFVE
jgi:hypothetical protein